jgi:16S rRNA (adenine1518-N6/adenine1519-N6)-dimethyltransferase
MSPMTKAGKGPTTSMNETTPADRDETPIRPGEIRRLLTNIGVAPYKGWGQHFLADPGVPRRMVEIAEIEPGDAVIEVGPGLGILTEALLQAGAEVTAVEVDPRLAAYLRERFAGNSQLQLVEADFLRLGLDRLASPERPVKLVANLPYAITSAALRHALAGPRRPSSLVVMVQEEVARRIVAAPPEMSLLAVSVQLFGRPRLALRVPSGAFVPPPKVDSAVVAMRVEEPPLPDAEHARFFRVVAAGFAQRRKTLLNSLAAGLSLPRPALLAPLAAAGVDPLRRAQTLALDEWLRLDRALGALVG